MPRLAIAEAFVQNAKVATTIDALNASLLQSCEEMGVRYFALTHHIDFGREGGPAVRLHNYPQSWQEWFDGKGLGRSDPIHRACHFASFGFPWASVPTMIKLTPDDRFVLDRAYQVGIGEGFTIPASVPGEILGSCSFAVDAGQPFPEEYHYICQLVGAFAFEAARRLSGVRDVATDQLPRPGVHTAVQAMLDQSLLDRRSGRHLFVTGHSKGGALANLFAVRAARQTRWADLQISVATIAAARAGNSAFAKSYAESRIACLRYELDSDPVPHLPPGPQMPGFVQTLARTLFPKLTTADYVPVGERVTAGEASKALKPWAGARQTRRLAGLLRPRGFSLSGLLPPQLTAHAICPGSGYDRLVCLGEAECDHGRDEVRARA